MSQAGDKFINTVIYRVDRKSLKRVRDTNRALTKDFQKIEKARNPYRAKKSPEEIEAKRREKVRNQELRDTKRHQKAMNNQANKAQNQSKSQLRRQASKGEKADIFLKENFGKGGKFQHNPNTSRRDQANLRRQLMMTNSTREMNHEMRKIVRKEREALRLRTRSSSIMNKMSASAMGMATGFASAYTAVEAFNAIVQTGMKAEGVKKSMLVTSVFDENGNMFEDDASGTAASKNAEQAAKNLSWVRDEAMRLGTPLLDAQKGFSSLLAAAGDKMKLADVKTVFTSVAEASTVLGLSSSDTQGTILALKQMMSKGKIQADELTQQLGERLPFAMRAMTAAALKSNKTKGLMHDLMSKKGLSAEAALFKLMEGGKLLSADILPEFGRQLGYLSNANGALAKALAENLNPALGVTKNLFTELQIELYDGMMPALKFTLDALNNIGFASKGVGSWLGEILGKHIFRVTNFFSSMYVAVHGVVTELQKLSGISLPKWMNFGNLADNFNPIGRMMDLSAAAANKVSGMVVNRQEGRPMIPHTAPVNPTASSDYQPSTARVHVTIEPNDNFSTSVENSMGGVAYSGSVYGGD